MPTVGVTIEEAAQLFNVRPKTVESWLRRNRKIRPVGRRGRALEYDYHALAEAEFTARENGNLRTTSFRRSILD